ncbi:MAG: competence/damage-inducible protein A [Candidatus Saccharicenans sp.]|nr:competence/damage-inducible protein A [Candidatus Saccharicenans sp.]MDH7493367.1 competence/damage-inducible protein A [Candidatus Saccharicenans sp.]
MGTPKRKRHRIEFIAVGSELLSPHFLETNSLYLAEKLQELGWRLSFKTVVGDNLEELKEAVGLARQRSWLILISGGLGPTEDDRTRQAVAEVLGARLVFNQAILEKIRQRFESRGLRMTPSNRRQAYVIEGAEVLDNPHGTAPGLWLESRKEVIILLPGPPSELKPMVENLVLPRLKKYGQVRVLRASLRITGAGESFIEDRIKPVYKDLPENLQLITLASPADIQIRLEMTVGSQPEKDEKTFERIKNRIIRRLGPLVYSVEGRSLEEVVGQKLKAAGLKLACAESCSGGLLANRLTNVPGSSDYFLEGLVTYSNQSKMRELGVPEELLAAKGAVSEEVARVMAENMREKSGADLALSTTGIAGPGGGTPAKPVGLVYTALAFPGGSLVIRNLFRGNREQIKFQATQKALDMLRLKLIEMEKKTQLK